MTVRALPVFIGAPTIRKSQLKEVRYTLPTLDVFEQAAVCEEAISDTDVPISSLGPKTRATTGYGPPTL